MNPATIDRANEEACRRLYDAEPILTDVLPAGDAIHGYKANTILTSGPQLAWDDYQGGQRAAIIGSALFEGLAKDEHEADALIRAGKIEVLPCHRFNCVGSLAGGGVGGGGGVALS